MKSSERPPRWSAEFRDKVAILVAAALLALIAAGGFFGLSRSGQSDQQSPVPTMAAPATGPNKVAIVDQLSLTEPNPAFVETTEKLLERAGYIVDYFPGEEVTVDFYRDLPTHGYSLVILRNHSSVVRTTVSDATGVTGLYTSEPYSKNKYSLEQKTRRLIVAWYNEGGPQYFGIAPEFVRSSMKGDFAGATVILMGCDGLSSEMLAEALLERGAGAVIGWTGLVSATHTDAATEHLLQHHLLDGLPMQQALEQTMAEVGPDPEYDSTLLLYPSDEPVSAAP